ncbi:putative nucleotidyltransferase [Azospirillum agricola]|uniref:nucleotidyltransferase domain-containing protein n=1 Tax=Azospirillum agricola TaxID=1720247 RepID=UPI001AE724FB|nr:nucleotidyltransferase domain-containing protein [Azospirillum agricola]MBP2230410.1 putative nucleotidyltransferase [Azospirillum agricola]
MTIDPIPSAVRQRIAAKLDRIERDSGVRILLAVESGSRAWGFASPDSDYDVRFLYVRPLDRYLTLTRERDVIELPIEDDLDINGWDIAKALALLGKANPVLFEWLSSPIRYRADEESVRLVQAFAGRVTHRTAAIYHYRSLAAGNLRRHIDGQDRVRLKKYFYGVRPACALAWLRTRPEDPLPMALGALMDGLVLTPEIRKAIGGLLAHKRQLSEMGEGPRIGVLDAFIASEIAAAVIPDPTPNEKAALAAEADRLFRRLVRGPLEDASRPQEPAGSAAHPVF